MNAGALSGLSEPRWMDNPETDNNSSGYSATEGKEVEKGARKDP